MEARVRLILCDPDFYVGRKIKLPTDGMYRVDDKLIYRLQADKPPVLICNITPPDLLPTYIVGVCSREPDGVIVLSGCYFTD